MLRTARRGSAAEVPAYDRNDVTAPSFDIITDRGRIRSWSSAGGSEWAHRIIAACQTSGDRVLSFWINPGPDFGAADAAPILLAAE